MPVFTNTERLALAGFLAGYSGLTREAYALDLRQERCAFWRDEMVCERVAHGGTGHGSGTFS
jgi:hypothetical protein